MGKNPIYSFSFLHLSVDGVEVVVDRRFDVKLHVLVGCVALVIRQEEVVELLLNARSGQRVNRRHVIEELNGQGLVVRD